MKLDVVLAQPGYRTGPKHKNNWYLPYTIGCLWAHASQDQYIKDNVTIVEWIWKRNIIEDLIKSWSNVDVLFCSVYIWSENYCSELSKQVKQKWPHAKVIWGGPQCDYKDPNYFIKKPYIDVVAVSEGEYTFEDICTHLINEKPLNEIQSCVINQNGISKTNSLRPRSNLEDFPSPYITGVFNKIIEDNPDVSWTAILETNRGCPYSCTFCDWGSLTGSKIKQFTLEKIKSEIEWFQSHRISWIMIADANFGIFKDRDMAIAKMLRESQEKHNYLDGITNAWLKNKPDSIIEIAREMKDIMGNGVTLSAQSMDPHTLKNIKRNNMEINNVGSLMDKLDKENIPYYMELILGMPGESLESWKEGHWNLYDVGFHKGIAVYQLLCIVNTELHDRQVAEFGIKTRNTPVIDDDNHIAEFAPAMISSNTMPYEDYIEAWVFSKTQNLLHSTGFALKASVVCNEAGIEYKKFYDELKKNLTQHTEWQDMIYDMTNLFHQVFSESNRSATERQIDAKAFASVFSIRSLIFDCVKQTLDNFQIENADKIIEHSKALVYDPYQPHLWPQNIDGKIYTYVGPKDLDVEAYCEFQAHRRRSVFVEVT